MKIKDFGTLKIGLTEYINNKNGIKPKILIDFNAYFNINIYDFKKNKKFNSNLYPKIIQIIILFNKFILS